MDDLEITRRCAEAMKNGAKLHWFSKDHYAIADGFNSERYDPPHDDAQCMTLIVWLASKGVEVRIAPEAVTFYRGGKLWCVCIGDVTQDKQLNRAVCTAVAQMEVERG